MRSPPDPPRSPERRALRVLLAEDSPDDAELLTLELRRSFDAQVQRVDTLEQLAHELEHGAWDLMISDYHLVGFTALEVLQTLKASGRDLPFILVSGAVGEEVAAEVMKAGADDFFLKDRLARLASAIERELREKAELRQALAERERLLNELRQAVSVRDEFLMIASHELKTPITALRLQVESGLRALEAEHLDRERLTDRLGSALRQVERLTTLVSNLLEVTRSTSGGQRALERERLDLRDVVHGVLARQREVIKRSGSEVVVLADGPIVGTWDLASLENVVSNLISNAVKFGRGAPIEVTVTSGDGRARLTVADQGFGIDARDQQRIFGPFERAVPVEHYGGFGLGLWITRNLVEAHGGCIHVSSTHDVGSSFVVELPFDEQRRTP
jgi:signal transduction histidine kinase